MTAIRWVLTARELGRAQKIWARPNSRAVKTQRIAVINAKRLPRRLVAPYLCRVVREFSIAFDVSWELFAVGVVQLAVVHVGAAHRAIVVDRNTVVVPQTKPTAPLVGARLFAVDHVVQEPLSAHSAVEPQWPTGACWRKRRGYKMNRLEDSNPPLFPVNSPYPAHRYRQIKGPKKQSNIFSSIATGTLLHDPNCLPLLLTYSALNGFKPLFHLSLRGF